MPRLIKPSQLSRQAFTLVELLVVLIVISVLIGFTTVRVLQAIDSAQNSQSRVTAMNAYKSAQAFFTDNDESYGSTGSLVAHMIADGLDAEAMASAGADPSAEGKIGVFVGGPNSLYIEHAGLAGTNYYVQDSAGTVTSGVATSGGPTPVSSNAFVFYDGVAASTVRLESDGSARTVLNSINPIGYVVSPDRTKILYDYLSGVTGEYVIGGMDADGSNAGDITSNVASNSSPNWAPDGSKIYFTSWRNFNFDIYSMDPDGSNQTNLTAGTGLEEQSPVVSPDGTKIAYTVGTQFSYKEIYVMNNDGSGRTRLTTRGADFDVYPQWIDNSTIAFIRHSGPSSNVFKIDTTGAGLTQLTTTNNITEIAAASDGSYIFTLMTNAQRVGRVNSAGGGEIYLTSICPDVATALTVSPDDSTVAFLCNSQIYTADATVGAPAAPNVVPNTGGSPTSLMWSGQRPTSTM